MVLHKGVVVEEGSHEELMKLKSHYFELVTAQTAILEEDEVKEGDIGVSAERRKFSKQISVISRTSQVSSVYEEEGDEFVPDTVKKFIQDFKNSLLSFLQEYLENSEIKKTVPLMEVIKLSNPEWKSVALGTVASMLMGFGTPVFAIIFGDVMGVFANPDEDAARDDTNWYCVLFLIVGIVMGVSTFLQIYTYGVAGEWLTMRMRSRAFSSMLKQEVAWFDIKSNSVGALCARLSGDASAVQGVK